MNNLLSFFGLVDAKMRASDINLPVISFKCKNYIKSEINMHWKLALKNNLYSKVGNEVMPGYFLEF